LCVGKPKVVLGGHSGNSRTPRTRKLKPRTHICVGQTWVVRSAGKQTMAQRLWLRGTGNARTSGECTNSHARSQHCELEHSRAFPLLFAPYPLAHQRVLSLHLIVPRRRHRGVVRTGRLLLLPCLPDVHDLRGRGLTAAGPQGGSRAEQQLRLTDRRVVVALTRSVAAWSSSGISPVSHGTREGLIRQDQGSTWSPPRWRTAGVCIRWAALLWRILEPSTAAAPYSCRPSDVRCLLCRLQRHR
jgi:hypothetical protein